jgi:hypothetical protein
MSDDTAARASLSSYKMSPELTAALERARIWHETATPEEKEAMWQLQRKSFAACDTGATDGCGTTYLPATPPAGEPASELLDAIAAASPLPWSAGPFAEGSVFEIEDADGVLVATVLFGDCCPPHAKAKANAAFIVSAANSVPTLLADIDRLTGLMNMYRDRAGDADLAQFAAEARAIAAEQKVEAMREALEIIQHEAARENSKWPHIKRCIAVQARAALSGATSS